jgi:hypothetical protein
MSFSDVKMRITEFNQHQKSRSSGESPSPSAASPGITETSNFCESLDPTLALPLNVFFNSASRFKIEWKYQMNKIKTALSTKFQASQYYLPFSLI